MSLYSEEYNFVFIHIPKNAGSTFVINYCDDKTIQKFETLNSKLGFSRDPVFGNHMTYLQIKNLIENNNVNFDLKKSFKFCTIRNPWERMVSLYHHRMRKINKLYKGKPRNSEEDKIVLRKGFNYWLLNTQHVSDKVLTIKPQIEWITDRKGNIVVDKIINVNNYDQELDKVLDKLKVPKIKRKDFNRSKKKSSNYKSMYNKETKKHIEKYFEKDIEQFGFKF